MVCLFGRQDGFFFFTLFLPAPRGPGGRGEGGGGRRKSATGYDNEHRDEIITHSFLFFFLYD